MFWAVAPNGYPDRRRDLNAVFGLVGLLPDIAGCSS
jgi:hypothetical protein